MDTHNNKMNLTIRPYDLHESIMEAKMWGDIKEKAKTDPILQDLLDRVVLYYKLKNGKN